MFSAAKANPPRIHQTYVTQLSRCKRPRANIPRKNKTKTESERKNPTIRRLAFKRELQLCGGNCRVWRYLGDVDGLENQSVKCMIDYTDVGGKGYRKSGDLIEVFNQRGWVSFIIPFSFTQA